MPGGGGIHPGRASGDLTATQPDALSSSNFSGHRAGSARDYPRRHIRSGKRRKIRSVLNFLATTHYIDRHPRRSARDDEHRDHPESEHHPGAPGGRPHTVD